MLLNVHGGTAFTWKLPWWDSKSPGKVNLGSGTVGMRSVLTLKWTWRVWSGGLATPSRAVGFQGAEDGDTVPLGDVAPGQNCAFDVKA